MLFTSAQVGPHSRCQKVRVMNHMRPTVSANHSDAGAHGSSLLSLLPWHTWPSPATGEKQPCAQPVLRPGLVPGWTPMPVPPTPCTHALPCSPAGDTASQGCTGGFPRSVGTTFLSSLFPCLLERQLCFCPWLPGPCEGPEACLLSSVSCTHRACTSLS